MLAQGRGRWAVFRKPKLTRLQISTKQPARNRPVIHFAAETSFQALYSNNAIMQRKHIFFGWAKVLVYVLIYTATAIFDFITEEDWGEKKQQGRAKEKTGEGTVRGEEHTPTRAHCLFGKLSMRSTATNSGVFRILTVFSGVTQPLPFSPSPPPPWSNSSNLFSAHLCLLFRCFMSRHRFVHLEQKVENFSPAKQQQTDKQQPINSSMNHTDVSVNGQSVSQSVGQVGQPLNNQPFDNFINRSKKCSIKKLLNQE